MVIFKELGGATLVFCYFDEITKEKTKQISSCVDYL